MIISKQMDKICSIAEKNGWSVSHQYEKEDSVYILFSKLSPAGQDFNVEVTVDASPEEDFYRNVCDAIIKFWDGFDVCEEAYLWLDNTGHGKNGAPQDMKDLYEDMEACGVMVADLWFELNGKKRPTETKPKQCVYEVFKSDAWHTNESMEHIACYLTLEDAVNAILKHGNFNEDEDLEYVREHLLQYRQTPEIGDTNYDISIIEVGSWNE